MDPEEWSHSLGSAPLTEIWEMGYRDLGDLENPFQPGDVKDFVKKTKLEDNRIEMRKKTLARQAERIAAARAKAAAATSASTPTGTQENAAESTTKPAASTSTSSPSSESMLHPSLPAKPSSSSSSTKAPENAQAEPAPTPAPTPTPPAATPAAPERVATPAPAANPTPPDEQIAKLEENKQRWAWLALRTARDQHLSQFAKIGTGDIVALAAEIEREREARENAAALESGASPIPSGGGGSSTQDAKSADGATRAGANGGPASARDAEGDVKMEG